MGIHGLNPIIKKQNPNVYQTCHYSKFSGKSLAMDVSIFLHKYIHADRNNWFSSLVTFFIKMKKENIHIIAIFDGEHVPVEKLLEREHRKVSSNKSKDRLDSIKQLQQLIYTLYTTSHEGYAPSVSEEHQLKVSIALKLKLKNNLQNEEEIDLSDGECCLRELAKLEDKILNQNARVDSKIVQSALELVQALGIPHVVAYGEAEALCASLAIHGYTDGVLSRDTDTLVYGAPLFVNDFKGNEFSWTTLEVVLDSLQLTQKEFIDFCIMCGCDYNTNMKGVAGGNAYKFISEYGSIENIELNKDVDTTCLRYKRCREIFVPYSKEYLNGYTFSSSPPNKEKITELFDNNNCFITFIFIDKVWKTKHDNLEFID